MRLRPEGGLVSATKPPTATEAKQASDADRLRDALVAGQIRTVKDAELVLDKGYKAARDALERVGAHQVGSGRESYWSLNGNTPPSI
jgi:hypothetical protein